MVRTSLTAFFPLPISFARLGLDYVDLYLIHSPSGGDILETWDTLVDFKKQGFIRWDAAANQWFSLHNLSQEHDQLFATYIWQYTNIWLTDLLIVPCIREGAS